MGFSAPVCADALMGSTGVAGQGGSSASVCSRHKLEMNIGSDRDKLSPAYKPKPETAKSLKYGRRSGPDQPGLRGGGTAFEDGSASKKGRSNLSKQQTSLRLTSSRALMYDAHEPNSPVAAKPRSSAQQDAVEKSTSSGDNSFASAHLTLLGQGVPTTGAGRDRESVGNGEDTLTDAEWMVRLGLVGSPCVAAHQATDPRLRGETTVTHFFRDMRVPDRQSRHLWQVGTALVYAFIFHGRLLPYREAAARQKTAAEFFHSVTSATGHHSFENLIDRFKTLLDDTLSKPLWWATPQMQIEI